MKSAYELAMERLGGGKHYTDKQKKALADTDAKYEAKRVEARFAAEKRLRETADNPAQQDEIRRELARDLERLEEKKEAEKETIRRQA